jgi:hypothetical protein
MARMKVIFEDALLDEMQRIVPPRQRSRFIEGAVRARLTQLTQIEAAEAAAGAWSGEGRGNPSQEIEGSRHAWEGRMLPSVFLR